MARDDDEGFYFPPVSGGEVEKMIHEALNDSSHQDSSSPSAGASGACFNASLLEQVRHVEHATPSTMRYE